MSKAGEIPANEVTKANMQEDGEVLVAAAVVDGENDDDGSTSCLVEAKVVEDDPPPEEVTKPAAVTTTDDSKVDDDKQKKSDEGGTTAKGKDCEILNTNEISKTAPGSDEVAQETAIKEEDKDSQQPAKNDTGALSTGNSKTESSMGSSEKTCKVGVTDMNFRTTCESTSPETKTGNGDGAATAAMKSEKDANEKRSETKASGGAIDTKTTTSNAKTTTESPLPKKRDDATATTGSPAQKNEDDAKTTTGSLLLKKDDDATKTTRESPLPKKEDDAKTTTESPLPKKEDDQGVEDEEIEDGEVDEVKPVKEAKSGGGAKPVEEDSARKDSKKDKSSSIKPLEETHKNSDVEDLEMADAEKVDDKNGTKMRGKESEVKANTSIIKVEKEKLKENRTNTRSVKKGDKIDGGNAKEETDEEGEINEEMEEDVKADDTEEEGEIKEDVDMEDALSQSEEGDRDADTASADVDPDTASVDGDSVMEDAKKVEPSYSTRGRASGSTTPVPRETIPSAKGPATGASAPTGASNDQWERSVREALEDLGRGTKETPPAGVGPGGSSFLEALGEEERRTRTRFLPAVDGIHMLRKGEIKSDLTLARSIMSNSGNVTSVAAVAAGATSSFALLKKSRGGKKKQDSSSGEAEAMDTDDGDLSTASDDDPASDVGIRLGSSSTIEFEKGDVLVVPSTAFVPPPAATQITVIPTAPPNGEKKEDGTPVAPVVSTGVKGILNNQRNIKSPKVVESVTAFNPPRPPESVGKKKQHRMLRWERRPADVEVDLNNYRKTVDRTRKELHAAEDELERIETTSNHLRRHFLGHLRCMEQEYEQITAELSSVQQQCVIASDLLTSRTRSRGAGKGNFVMKDVLTVLKARGAELSEKGLAPRADIQTSTDVQKNFPGLGGVGASGFADWNQHTAIKPHTIASAWVLPGDRVDTPYGEGVAVKILDNAALNVKEPLIEAALSSPSKNGHFPSKTEVNPPTRKAAPSSSQKSSSSPGAKGASGEKKTTPDSDLVDLNTFLGPRICVRFPYGIGYFKPDAVTSKESPHTLSDAQLVKRWRGLIETSLSQAGRLDLEGMASPFATGNVISMNDRLLPSTDEADVATNGGASPLEIDMKTNNEDTGAVSIYQAAIDPNETKLLPFGSGLLPTGTGRGNALFDMDALQLQKEMKPLLSNGGTLGYQGNDGVPSEVKDFEAQKQESYILQAEVFHLRNQLYRQRRIRTLNERTFAATRDRSTRVESLVAEMRTDLNSLKSRLDEELKELGIDQDKAEAILKAYYLSQEYDDEEVDEGEEEAEKVSTTDKRTREDLGDGNAKKRSDARTNSKRPETEMERQTKRVKVASH